MLAESTGIDVGMLTGFENHQGDARLGPEARPLARVVVGIGNGHEGGEGAVQRTVVGTYMHAPALVRNDRLTDHLLTTVVGALQPFDDEPGRRLRIERRNAALSSPRQRWRLRRTRRERRPS